MYYARKAEPRSSKLLYERELAERHKRHKDRLRRMKPSVDNKPPKRFVHLERNLKKEQMQEDRFAQIEHENRLLLHRMSEIMNRRTLDNTSSEAKFGRSLNRDARKKELHRITAENQAILRRIQGAEPVYNHWKWEEEGIKHAKLVDSICEFPAARRSRTSRPHAAAAAASMSTGMLPPVRGSRAGGSASEAALPMRHDYGGARGGSASAADLGMGAYPSGSLGGSAAGADAGAAAAGAGAYGDADYGADFGAGDDY
ncbi:hypothetical protein FNF27_05322 [Cafeteria roenbergensis]|uniref:Cilia- and flagella-associated protein 97 n=1 Tax=Cafeteria roenbergensis TaxID=33653 RepID=A0A5A8C0U4_CAFRO|nr:hypothetical protein FNF29_08196 [Cafeteria roenbergensis]KAA0173234.1 hypothetical protein FNF27_05322 [Cafeteria roenbergensis]|eukprot:KAA0146179.1 hypothetical protein FNF29_08196 [Cafeteria roenbergensis]